MTVGLAGSGPAAEAVEAALGDVDAVVERTEADDVVGHEVGVVVAQAGSSAFERANEAALEEGRPWFAVELGGIGGYPVVDAAVVGFDPENGCYDCLAARVGSNVEPEAEPRAALPEAEARFAGAVGGRQVGRHLGSGAGDPLGQVVELPYAERELLAVPGCRCDEGRDRVLDRGSLDRSLSRSLARAERGLDDRVGIVAEVGEAESYPAPYYIARLCDTSEFSDTTAQQGAAGSDEDWDRAFVKALGEGLERYCAGVYREDEFDSAAPDEVDDAVAPAAFVTPGDRETPASDETIEWVRGQHLATGERVRLPAELVHYPPPTERIRPAITTGLGLGDATVEALLSGLYEVVERDASTIAWYSTYEPLGIAVEHDRFERLAGRAGAEGLDVTALLLTQDVDVPVVGVAVRREEWPAVALGTAANLDPAAAAADALAEAVQNWVELREMGREAAADAEGAIARYAADPGDLASFLEPETTVPASSVGPDEVPEGPEELSELLGRVDEAGLAAYAARTTTRDVRRLGFEAVRVLVPAAQPLSFGEPYFGSRAETVPADLGFEPRLDRDHHPYP
jgi:ribosomal protein S12 methylthiotransferase accessory factor